MTLIHERKRRWVCSCLICLGILLGLPISVWAEPEMSILSEMSLEELADVEVETVYSASRYEQKVTDAPSFVTIVTSEEIKKFGYRTLGDILRGVSGFYVSYDRMYNTVGVRGFGRLGDVGNRVQVLLDGRRFNDVIYAAAVTETGFILDIDLIDRVEIIRGPGSSLYGSNAFFAVINVVSKSGGDFQGFELSAERASLDTHKERATYGWKYKDGPEMLFSFSNLNSKGHSDLYFNEFDDPSTNNGIAHHADKEKSYSAFSKIIWGDFTAQGGYVIRDKRVPTAPFGTIFNDNRTELSESFWSVDLKYEHSFEGLFDFMARMFYNRHDFDGDYAYDYAEDGDPPDVVMNFDKIRDYWWGGEVQFTRVFFDKHKLIWGGETIDNGRQDQANYDIYGIYLDDKKESDRWGVYVQDEFELLDNLTVIAGFRHDQYGEFGGTTNPRLALIYKASDRTRVKFLYGEAFRTPTPYEMFYTDGGETQKPSQSLEPETIKTYELILQRKLAKGLWANISGFIYKIDNLINLETDPADGLLVHQNSGGALAKGMEVEVTGKSPSGWQGRAGYTFVQAEDEESHSTLTNSPKHLAKLNLIAPLIEKKVFAGVEVQFTGKRKTMADSHSSGFLVTNLTIYGEEIFKGVDFSFTVYNLFDKKFQDPASDEHTQDMITQDGRMFAIQLVSRF